VRKDGNPLLFSKMPDQDRAYSISGVSLINTRIMSYDLQDFQIAGGPKWLDSDRFDIVATSSCPNFSKAELSSGPTQQQLMLRSHLADRFKLAVHNETRQLPVFALVVAHAVGRLGPELRRLSVGCAALAAARTRVESTPPPPSGDRPLCGSRVFPGAIMAGGITKTDFVRRLSMLSMTGSSLGRMVIDRTGLSGAFDINLHFTPDRIPDFGPGGPVIDPNGPSVLTALQEQLGLKLDSQRGPVDVLVIDRAEIPVEN